MQKIPLSEISPSPNPIRKTWDEGKMEELAQSIKERGVIVPIKVRPNGNGYEVVYGHRRVEAARMAEKVTIPVFVEGIDDTEALIQALIENVQREDMEPIDLAVSLKALKEKTGWSSYDIENHGIMVASVVRRTLQLLSLAPDVQEKIGRAAGSVKTKPLTPRHADMVKGVDHSDLRNQILRKAAKEGLTSFDTKAVADAYKEADTPELKEKVLETSGKLGSADNILTAARMKIGADAITDRHQQESQKAFEDFDQSTKDFIDGIRLFDKMTHSAFKAVQYGKFSPESAAFVSRRIDAIISGLRKLQEKLSDVQ